MRVSTPTAAGRAHQLSLSVSESTACLSVDPGIASRQVVRKHKPTRRGPELILSLCVSRSLSERGRAKMQVPAP